MIWLSYPEICGDGGEVKVGVSRFDYPTGSRVVFSETPAGEPLALVETPQRVIHVLHERGEVYGLPESLLKAVQRRFFPD